MYTLFAVLATLDLAFHWVAAINLMLCGAGLLVQDSVTSEGVEIQLVPDDSPSSSQSRTEVSLGNTNTDGSNIKALYTSPLGLGFFSFLGLLIFGLFATRLPQKGRWGERQLSRQQRMARQGGHTTMLLYFLGLAPLCEWLSFIQKPDESGHKRVSDAMILHSTCLAPVQLLVHLVALSKLQSPLALENGKSGTNSHADITRTETAQCFAQWAIMSSVAVFVLTMTHCTSKLPSQWCR